MMLEWFKKEDNVAESLSERTNNVSGGSDEEMLATISNRKIRRGISKVPATIGKNPNAADISFFHNSVDNVHCTIDCQSGKFTITDNESREGTKINGQKIEAGVPYIVNSGDHIVLGKVEFELNINYDELEKRNMAAANKQPEKPEERLFKVKARPVSSIEYDEAEVVYVSCGLEPEKKKAAFTQEFKNEQMREAIKVKAAEEKQAVAPAFVPEPDAEPVMPKEAAPMQVPAAKPAAVKALSLVCISGTGEEIVADHFPFRIGRSKSNDYTLKIDKISREHACLTEKGGMYYIIDTNSTNGIRVNGIRIEKEVEYRISEGDTIKLSDNIYRVEFPDQR